MSSGLSTEERLKDSRNKSKVLKSLLREKISENEVLGSQLHKANTKIARLEKENQESKIRFEAAGDAIAEHVKGIQGLRQTVGALEDDKKEQQREMALLQSRLDAANKDKMNLEKEKMELVEKFIDISAELDQQTEQGDILRGDLAELKELKRGLETKCDQMKFLIKNDMAAKSQTMIELEQKLEKQREELQDASEKFDLLHVEKLKVEMGTETSRHRVEDLEREVGVLKERLEQHQRRAKFAHNVALRGAVEVEEAKSVDANPTSAGDRSVLLQEINKLEAKLDEAVVQKNSAMEATTEAQREIKRLQGMSAEANDKTEKAFASVELQVQQATDVIRKDVKKLEAEAVSLTASLDHAKNRETELESKNLELQQELAASRNKEDSDSAIVQQHKDEIRKLEAERRKLESKCKESISQLEKLLAAETSSSKNQTSENESLVEQLQAVTDSLKQAEQVISEKDSLLQRHADEAVLRATAMEAIDVQMKHSKEQMQQHLDTIEQLRAEVGTLKDNLANTQQQEKGLEHMRQRCDKLQGLVKRHEKTIEDLHFTNQNLYQSLSAVKGVSEQAERSKESTVKEMENLEEKFKETEDELVEAHAQVERSDAAILRLCKTEHDLRSRLSKWETGNETEEGASFMPSGKSLASTEDDTTYARTASIATPKAVVWSRDSATEIAASERIIYEGYMEKQPFGFSFSSGFRKRLFVLRQRRLEFFHVHSDDSRSLRGEISLTGRIKLRRGNIDNGVGIEIVRLSEPKNTYPMKCESEQERDHWFRALDMVLRGVDVNKIASLLRGVKLFGGSLLDGVDLTSRIYVEQDKAADTDWKEAVERGIPYVICHTGRHLLTHGLTAEGLFRVPGNAETIQAFCGMYEKGNTVALRSDSADDIYDAAGVLKAYLGSLTEAVIPTSITASLQQITHMERQSEEQKWKAIREKIEELAPPNRRVLCFLVDLMVQVDERAHVNKMPKENIAKVFAPSLFSTKPTRTSSDPWANVKDNAKCLHTMLQGHKVIFEQPG